MRQRAQSCQAPLGLSLHPTGLHSSAVNQRRSSSLSDLSFRRAKPAEAGLRFPVAADFSLSPAWRAASSACSAVRGVRGRQFEV